MSSDASSADPSENRGLDSIAHFSLTYNYIIIYVEIFARTNFRKCMYGKNPENKIFTGI